MQLVSAVVKLVWRPPRGFVDNSPVSGYNIFTHDRPPNSELRLAYSLGDSLGERSIHPHCTAGLLLYDLHANSQEVKEVSNSVLR